MKAGREGSKGRGIKRRTLVKWLLGLGVGSMLAAMASGVNSLKPLIRLREKEWPKAGDRLVFAVGPDRGKVITVTGLAYGEATLALPQGKESNEENIITLVKLAPEEFLPPTKVEWTAEGVVAYSAICTHLACTVLESLRSGEIYCPCHAGIYDPRRGAEVIGGPPPRPLPQLPIKIEGQGMIIAAGGFEGPVGVCPSCSSE
ncbi:MAG: ubiquinol-cytochrome c reductase iron-sulfur subunit [Candidatus Bipolaricaulia bacterium]